MKKRHFFEEITEGFDALAQERQDKKTLRTTKVKAQPIETVTPEEVRAIREGLHLSQPVFALYLRTNHKTLQNWEQGRAKPNAQANLLLKMVARFPDTVQRLGAF
jgi:putative transcriptional regulator